MFWLSRTLNCLHLKEALSILKVNDRNKLMNMSAEYSK